MSTKISKFMSLVLRHKPEVANLTLSDDGWVSVDDLIAGAKANNIQLDFKTLLDVVETNNKKRFVLSPDNKRIRAAQGHSVEVDLGLQEQTPPDILYHGTKQSTVDIINEAGIQKMSRHAVHLSADTETASNVAGRRRGDSVVLNVLAKEMFNDGYKFFQSENGVWLTDFVPPKYLA